MNTNTTTTRPAITIGELRISTDLAIHPGFTKKPDKFALKHNVKLVDSFLPEVSFKKDYDTGGKFENAKANICLVHRDAIRLFVHNDGGGYRLRSIAVNPAELMHYNERRTIPCNMSGGLELLKTNVAPLLANRSDVPHIIPGFPGDDGEHCSCWSEASCSILLPNYEISCFHGLAHPLTGPAQGSTKKRIELSGGNGGCTIRFDQTHWEGMASSRLSRVNGVAVTLTLKGRALATAFESTGLTASVRGTKRLVQFSANSVVEVFLDVLRQTTGTYLPIPPEWVGMGKPVTHAKTIALLAQITSIPVDEIRAMDEAIRHPSKSTRQRLDDDVPAAVACLKPIPVASLFTLPE